MEIAPAAGGPGVNPTATAVAWIGGSWGAPEELQLPLADRGLQLADGLFETVWVEGGRPQLLQAHLRRWHHGAQLLGMAPPPTEAALEPLLQEAISRAGGQGALRLNWSRGNHRGRGLDLPEGPPMAEQHRFWLQLTPCRATFTPLTAAAAEPGDRWLLINSLSCRPVLKLEGQPLGDWPGAAADAERLWRRLLVPAGLDQLQP
ncbi:MAG: hypothetical protein EB136_05250 [Synechococcaceae bacterium WBB_3_034]|nr:hypothetical protein [Synechococcaceae bacterium WBB_3_034]